MAKAKPVSEVVIEETEEKPVKKGEETPPETQSKGMDWKKPAVIAAMAIIGLWLLFRRKDGKKTDPQPGKEPGTSPASTGDRFGGLRKL